MPERIIAAAILINGVTISLPKPARHGQVDMSLIGIVPDEIRHRGTQGFLTSEGRFVNRVQARQIAHIAGQNPLCTGGAKDLYSEDLW